MTAQPEQPAIVRARESARRVSSGQTNQAGVSPRVLSMGAITVAIGLWFLVTNLGWVNPQFFPSPQSVWSAFVKILTDGYKS